MNIVQMRPGHVAQGLRELIEYVSTTLDKDDLTMIEIGSYTGESTVLFAEKFKVTTIDPFKGNYDEKDVASYTDFEKVYDLFKQRTQGKNVTLIRETSDRAVNFIKDRVDFIYIDGLHTYDQVKKDIKNYKQFVKPGGFIGGHDYSRDWPGVVDAVNESFGKPLKIFRDTSWIVSL